MAQSLASRMTTFDYRRRLTRKETLRLLGAATGAGVAVGAGVAAAAFYLGRLWLQRVPLSAQARAVPAPRESSAPHRPPR